MGSHSTEYHVLAGIIVVGRQEVSVLPAREATDGG